jgi:DNA polymerase-3 subunit gamma/tau
VKIVPAVADDLSLAQAERTRGRAFAEKLSMRVLSRAWQMLLKGVTEVKESDRPLAAAEMVLVRLAYVADLPTPDEAIRALDGGGGVTSARAPGNNGGPASASVAAPATVAAQPRFDAPRGAPRAMLAPLPQAATETAPAPQAPALVVASFEEMIALAAQKRDIGVKLALERDVRLVRCEDGRLEIALEKSAAKTLVNDLSRKLSQWTNRRWMVVVSAETGTATLREQNEARQAELKTGVRADPLVAAVLARFPGAEIVDVRKADAPLALPAAEIEIDDAGSEPPPIEDGSAYGADWQSERDEEF